MRHFLTLLIIFWPAVGTATKPTKFKRPTTVNCHPKQLKRQDCHLQIGKFEVSLLAGSVTWNDGTWRATEPMPLKGEGVEWDRMTFDIFEGWPVLQMWIWDAGRGETKVQSLQWFTVSLQGQKLTPLAEGVVRKRRLQVAPSDGTDGPAKTEAILLEKPEPHGLKYLGDGKLEWQLNRQKKIIDRPREN